MKPSTVIVGLTGQTGAGKSTVSAYFEQSGYAVIDADLVSREVVEPGSLCLSQLTDAFGSQILGQTGDLNRKLLADIVFHDSKKLALLNEIIHPYITKRIREKIQQLEGKNRHFILLDAPTLFEAGADSLCDYIVSVIAPQALRLSRIKRRDKLTDEQAMARISAQHSEEFYRAHSSYVIENYGDLSILSEQAKAISTMIVNAAQGVREIPAGAKG